MRDSEDSKACEKASNRFLRSRLGVGALLKRRCRQLCRIGRLRSAGQNWEIYRHAAGWRENIHAWPSNEPRYQITQSYLLPVAWTRRTRLILKESVTLALTMGWPFWCRSGRSRVVRSWSCSLSRFLFP